MRMIFRQPEGMGSMGRSGGGIQFEYEGLLIKVDTPNFLFGRSMAIPTRM